MESEWYIRTKKGMQGPFSDDAIERYAREGRLKASHALSQDRQTWQSPEQFGFPTAETLASVDPGESGATRPAAGQADQTYFVRVRGQVQGPMTVKQLRQLVRRGKLARIHQVSTDQQVWRPASRVPGLFEPAKPQTPVLDAGPAPPSFEYQPPVVPPTDPAQDASLPPSPWTGVRRSGRAVEAAHALGPRGLNVTYLAGAVLLLGGFFLPWIDVVVFRLAGYQIPFLARKIIAGAGEVSGGAGVPAGVQLKVLSLYLLYLIPLSCAIGAARELSLFQQGRNCFASKLVSALSPVIAMFLILFVLLADVDLSALAERQPPTPSARSAPAPEVKASDVGQGIARLLDLLGVGFYMSLGGVIMAFIGAFINPAPREVYGARPRRRRSR